MEVFLCMLYVDNFILGLIFLGVLIDGIVGLFEKEYNVIMEKEIWWQDFFLYKDEDQVDLDVKWFFVYYL